MVYTLTISSQGQVVIPSSVRKALDAKPGTKLKLRLERQGDLPVAIIEPPASWIDRVRGIAKGVYGKGEIYVEKERRTWER